ncbi:MAG: hypothetical protein AAF211_28995, partial [Myxococcota bacterium]
TYTQYGNTVECDHSTVFDSNVSVLQDNIDDPPGAVGQCQDNTIYPCVGEDQDWLVTPLDHLVPGTLFQGVRYTLRNTDLGPVQCEAHRDHRVVLFVTFASGIPMQLQDIPMTGMMPTTDAEVDFFAFLDTPYLVQPGDVVEVAIQNDGMLGPPPLLQPGFCASGPTTCVQACSDPSPEGRWHTNTAASAVPFPGPNLAGFSVLADARISTLTPVVFP